MSCAGCARPSARPACSWSTTTAVTAPLTWPRGVGRELGGVEVLRRPGKAGLASAYRTGFSMGAGAGLRGARGHGRRPFPRRHRPSPHPGRTGGRGRRGRRVPLRPGGSTVDWPLGRRVLSRGGNWYAAHALDSSVADLTSAFRAYRATAWSTVDFSALKAQGYGWPHRACIPARALGGQVRRGTRTVHQPRRRTVQDVAEDRPRVAESGYSAGSVRAPAAPGTAPEPRLARGAVRPGPNASAPFLGALYGEKAAPPAAPTAATASGPAQAQLTRPPSAGAQRAAAGYDLLEPTFGVELEMERQQVVVSDRRTALWF